MAQADRFRRTLSPVLPPGQAELARSAQHHLGCVRGKVKAAALALTAARGRTLSVEVPPGALELVGFVLGALGEGRRVLVTALEDDLSTIEAAKLLGVSRPFVVKQIDEGRLPHRMVGTHRRVSYADLLAFERDMRKAQGQALDRMAADARGLGLGY